MQRGVGKLHQQDRWILTVHSKLGHTDAFWAAVAASFCMLSQRNETDHHYHSRGATVSFPPPTTLDLCLNTHQGNLLQKKVLPISVLKLDVHYKNMLC